MRNILVMAVVLSWFHVDLANADCIGCAGDLAIKKSANDIWGDPSTPDDSTHNHDFGALCDAANLASAPGEVHITITLYADLEGSTKYVTANFISGTETTPITLGNNFKNAPSDGMFFKADGVTSCGGERNRQTVQLDYDDFNALLAAGDGTMEIEVIASSAVEDLCNICCESGHSWTPDTCCGEIVPCSCPPGVQSRSEVILIYLDCDVVGNPFECVNDSDCNDNLYCSGTETCVDGACVATGNPCLATGKICNELTNACDNCVTNLQCQNEEGLFCDGDETCLSGTCQSGVDPCTPSESCDEKNTSCIAAPVCQGPCP